jgi:hypothetical protein
LAKRETNTKRQAKGKRETNAQRRKREDERHTTILAAKSVAEDICVIRRTKPELVLECDEQELKRLSQFSAELTLRQFCFSGVAPAKFLRLIDDFLDGKPPPYGPGKDWYDDKIKAAYQEATNRNLAKNGLPKGHVIQILAPADFVKVFENWRHHLLRSGKKQGEVAKFPPFLREVWRLVARGELLPPSEIPWPTFSEFLEVFREQKPELRGASDRSLRRSLKRLGLFPRPDKPGRPRGKKDRNPRLTR